MLKPEKLKASIFSNDQCFSEYNSLRSLISDPKQMLECYIYIIDFQQLANRHQSTKDKLLKFTHYRASTVEVFF